MWWYPTKERTHQGGVFAAPQPTFDHKKVKMWHRILAATSAESEDRRREVSHALADTNGEDGGTGDVAFAERLM